MSSPEFRLHAPPLSWRSWEGSHVVYHPASGSTHFLDPIAGALLRALEGGPGGAETLAVRIARDLAVEPPAEFHEQIQALLAHLERLGLAERAA